MTRAMHDPLQAILADRDVAILDGGLATELERRGLDLADPLWSAKVLVEDPDAIAAVHLDYFRAGADIAIGASYQASFAGFAARGIDVVRSAALLQKSVRLAQQARDRFLESAAAADRPRPLA